MHRGILVAVLSVISVLSAGRDLEAHPLGNFSISQYSAIRIDRNKVELRYLIDMAEIPTFQEVQDTGILAQEGDPSLAAYLARKAATLSEGLTLEINGKRLELEPASKEIIFPPGAGGLPTIKIGILYRVKLIGTSTEGQIVLNYHDGNFPGRAGWKEIIAVTDPDIKIIDSSVPEVDRSSQLSNYPTDLLNSPPQQLAARVIFTAVPRAPEASVRTVASRSGEVRQIARTEPLQTKSANLSETSRNPQPTVNTEGSPAVKTGSQNTIDTRKVQLHANTQSTPRNSFTELMATKQVGLGIILVAVAVAAGLGACHALEPGHGKTLVAAYLVGSRGTMKDALLLGLIVTAAHTAGVYLLGAVTLYASQYIVPERLYPWLGVASGVMITSMGAALLTRRYFAKQGFLSHHQHTDHFHASENDHPHEHRDHAHHFHESGHGHHRLHDGYSRYHRRPVREVSLRELLALGVSGGIVPCPAALVVLLSAVSMQRISFGLLLIVAFSVGLAAVLIAIGLLVVYAGQFMARLQTDSLLVTRWLPLASSTIITLFGLGIVIQAVANTGYFFS